MRKNHILQTIGFLAILSLILVPYANQAEAAPLKCKDEVLTGTIPNHVTVPKNKTCEIFDAVVEGNIKVDGTLIITDSTVEGNIFGKNSGFVDVMFTTVEGNINIQEKLMDVRHSTIMGNLEGKQGIDDIVFYDNVVMGNIIAFNNFSIVLISATEVNGNLLIKDNVDGGLVLVEANDVTGNAECSNNTGLTGEPNTVGGINIGCPSDGSAGGSSGGGPESCPPGQQKKGLC